MTWLRVYYSHDDCEVDPGVEWDCEWSCACDDDCPACGEPIQAVDYEVLEEGE